VTLKGVVDNTTTDKCLKRKAETGIEPVRRSALEYVCRLTNVNLRRRAKSVKSTLNFWSAPSAPIICVATVEP